MTKREQLYLIYLNALNTYNKLYGREDEVVRTDNEFVNSDAFRQEAKRAGTTAYLQGRINTLQREIDRKIEGRRAEDFFNTEDGALFMAHLVEQKENARKKRDSVVKNAQSVIENIVKNLLGEDWGARFSMGSTEVGILSQEEGKGMFVFGHNFTLMHGIYGDVNKMTIDDMRFDFSCGCMMAFPIFNDKDGQLRVKYEVGKGKFLSNTEALLEIRQTIFNAMVEIERLFKVERTISETMAHPKQEDLDNFLNK